MSHGAAFASPAISCGTHIGLKFQKVELVGAWLFGAETVLFYQHKLQLFLKEGITPLLLADVFLKLADGQKGVGQVLDLKLAGRIR